MSEVRPVFGADGGGTKTVGIIADGGGRVVVQKQAGATNPNVVGIETSAKTLLGLVLDCCRDAGSTPEGLGALVAGLAGVGTAKISESLRRELEDECRRQGIPPLPFVLETDARIALEGAFNGGPGIIVIAGTGSIVLGKVGEEKSRMVGGWGRVLGDEGSGYFLGIESLRAVIREIDGRGSSGRLLSMFAERFGWSDRDRVIAAVYKEQFPIPSLAPLVLEAAELGDQICRGILERGADHLADHIAPIAAAWKGPGPLGIVFIGGLIDHDTVYASILREKLASRFPHVVFQKPIHPPVFGAVILARKKLASK